MENLDGNGAPVVVEAGPGDFAPPPVPRPRPPPAMSHPIKNILLNDLWVSSDSSSVESALTRLADLCADGNEAHADNRACFYRIKGESVLCMCLRKWYKYPAIQAEGCRVFMIVCTGEQCSNMCMIESLALSGIVWAQKSYPKERNVQAYACGALANLVGAEKEFAAYLVNTLNGLDGVIAAMKEFSVDEQLQDYGCQVLDNLLDWQEFDGVVQEGLLNLLDQPYEPYQDLLRSFLA